MRVGVVGGDEVVDRLPPLRGAREAGVGERLPAQDAEPDLDLIEPGSVRGREVKAHPRLRPQPAILLGLVGGKIVEHDVDFAVRMLGENLIQ